MAYTGRVVYIGRLGIFDQVGDHLQFSVLQCQFTASDLVRCREALRSVIHHEKDQVLFVNLGPSEGRGVGFWLKSVNT